MLLLHLLTAVVALQATQAPDSAKLVRSARRAQQQYESLARRRAPLTLADDAAGPCDEVVGRMCLHFDPAERLRPLPPEPAAAQKARDEAIEALRRALARVPTDARLARALVRHLVEADRAPEAVAAAWDFAAATTDTLWAELLVGFALHAAGDDTAAQARFDAALARLPERERKRMRIEPLLAPEEAHALDKLGPRARERYEAALWTLADPLYLTPGNERRAEHVARYVWSRMLEEAPTAGGMLSWGDDLEELTLRYGIPRGRERQAGFGYQPDVLVERWDPHQLAFLPESLLVVGVRQTPDPGEPWELEDPASRTGYAPAAIRDMVSLPNQISRFPSGDSVLLRVDAAVRLDSLPPGAVPEAGLFVHRGLAAMLAGDTAERARALPAATLDSSRVRFSAAVMLPPGEYVYSAELWEPTSGRAARSRYAVTLAAPGSAPALSDIVVARAFPAGAPPPRRDDPRLRPLADLTVAPGDTVGLYAELSGWKPDSTGARPYRVRLELTPLRGPGLARRVLSLLGIAGGKRRVEIGWTGQAEAREGPTTIATNFLVPDLSDGPYALTMTVSGAGGTELRSERHLRLQKRR